MNIRVQVVYATSLAIWQRSLELPAGATALEGLRASGLLQAFPGLTRSRLAMGVFGQVCEEQHILMDGDRLEVYRSLEFDPLESRRRRALHRKAFMIKPRHRPKRHKAPINAEQDSSPEPKPK
jgi:putative ubiquitin-RnfH superfamily antitoxin RatB of RatAB toxin-antitoxin module